MSFTRMPLTAFGYTGLIAILLWDIIFDFTPNKEDTRNFYTVMRKDAFPFNLTVPFFILLSLIPLIANLLMGIKVLDMLTFALGLPSLYIFVGVLIPAQKEIVKHAASDSSVAHYYEVCKIGHLFLLLIAVLSLIFQLIVRSESECCCKNRGGCKSKKYSNISSTLPNIG